jgi:hypothetical protein
VLRFRLILSVSSIVSLAVLAWLAVLTFTLVAGEPGTAHVAECHKAGSRGAELVCTGTWRTAGGGTGSGKIYGLSRRDAGRTVEVRIGPTGPYGHGFGGSLHTYLISLMVGAGAGVLLVGVWRRLHRARSHASRLLAEPAPSGHLLVITGKGAHSPDGRPHATALKAAVPPPRPAAGVMTSRWEIRHPDGRPMLLVEQRSGKLIEPEVGLLDPAGELRAFIRRATTGPDAFALLAADGTPLGSITPARPTGGAYEIKDGQGRTWARTATRVSDGVLRLEPDAPPPFPDLALAFAFDRLDHPLR